MTLSEAGSSPRFCGFWQAGSRFLCKEKSRAAQQTSGRGRVCRARMRFISQFS